MNEEPFIEEIDRLFNVRSEEKEIKNIRFKIIYDSLNEGLLECELIGDQSHFKKVIRLYLSSPEESNLKVFTQNEYGKSITFDLVSIPTIPFHSSKQDSVVTYDQLSIEIDNLKIVKKVNTDIKNPRVQYHFTDPQSYWKYINDFKLDNKSDRVLYQNPVLENHNFPGKIIFQKKNITDNQNLRGNSVFVEASKDVLLFEFDKDLNPKEMINTCEPIVNIIEKQLSLLQRKRSVWYKYELLSKDKVVMFIQKYNRSKAQRPSHFNLIVNFRSALDFVNKTYLEFQKLSARKIDLVSPINYYLSALDVKYIEAKFGMLFFALEKLKDEIFKSSPTTFRGTIFNDKVEISFDEYLKEIKKSTKQLVNKKFSRKLIYEKMRELNRPSFKTGLKEILSSYNVEWKDLYRSQNDLNFIDIRNQLFHSNNKIDDQILFYEFLRLRSVFERLILKLLGWSNFENVPSKDILKLINKM